MNSIRRAEILLLAQDRDIVRLLVMTLERLDEIETIQRKTMSAIDDLNAKADALNAQIATNNAAIEALIALAKSKGASDDEIAAVTAKLDAGLQSLQTEDTAAAGATGQDTGTAASSGAVG